VSGGSGFGSQPSAPVEFGLGASNTADSVVVDWPSGRRSILVAVAAGAYVVDEIAAVDAPGAAGAPALALATPVPQPARGGSCRIAFTVPGSGSGGGTSVRLRLLDVAGRERRVLLDQELGPGPGTVAFDGRDARGTRLAGGLYFLELSAGSERATRRLVVLP
jgi:hypothetical protein